LKQGGRYLNDAAIFVVAQIKHWPLPSSR